MKSAARSGGWGWPRAAGGRGGRDGVRRGGLLPGQRTKREIRRNVSRREALVGNQELRCWPRGGPWISAEAQLEVPAGASVTDTERAIRQVPSRPTLALPLAAPWLGGRQRGACPAQRHARNIFSKPPANCLPAQDSCRNREAVRSLCCCVRDAADSVFYNIIKQVSERVR